MISRKQTYWNCRDSSDHPSRCDQIKWAQSIEWIKWLLISSKTTNNQIIITSSFSSLSMSQLTIAHT